MAGYDGRGARFPLTIVRGADLGFTLTVTSGGSAVDLSAATIAGEVYDTSGTLVDTLTATVSGGGNNVVSLAFTDTETTALTGTRYSWTLWVTRGGDKRPWLAGQVNVTDGTQGQSGSTGSYTLTVDEDLSVAIDVAAVGGSGGGASTLNDLTDVTITSAVTDNVLKYNGAAWVNGTVAGTGDMLAANNLSDLTNTTTARSNLGVAIGTNVQAYDAELAAIAGLTSAADRLPYFTGSGTASLATFTTAGRNLIDDADNTAQRTTLGLGTIATQAANSVTISGGSITGITDLAIADGGTGASTALGAIQNFRTAPATVSGTTDTLAGTDDDTVILYTAAGAVTVTLANIATGFECVLVCLGAGGLSVAAGGMSFANSFTPKLTVAQGEALYVKQTAASTFIVLGGTAT